MMGMSIPLTRCSNFTNLLRFIVVHEILMVVSMYGDYYNADGDDHHMMMMTMMIIFLLTAE